MSSDNLPNFDNQETSKSSPGNKNSDVIQSATPYHPPLRTMKTGLRYILSRFKSEIVFAILTIVLTLGQYYQGAYSTRTGIATLWREGYTSEVRNRVTKFAAYYKGWGKSAGDSLDILITPEEVFNGTSIRNDPNLKRLLDADVKKLRAEQKGKYDAEAEQEDEYYVEAALNYRNAIIEFLNTMEAVKAVIQARPWWINIFGINPDSLDARYNGVIGDYTDKLRPFIEKYRQDNPRETPPWIILTDEPSHWKSWVFAIVVMVGGIILCLVYGRKEIRNSAEAA